YIFENLPIDKTYVVKVSPEQPALEGYEPTIETEGNPEHDSSTWEATSVPMTEDGQHDPTLDFGFVIPEEPVDPEPTTPSVSVGDYVWFDKNKDGLQDEDEPGIPGVVLTIEDAEGNPVTDISGNVVEPTTTDENGYYIFENLPIDKTYVVKVSPEQPALEGYEPTIETEGNPDQDSSTWEATSVPMTEDGQHNPTLDFGFVIPEEVVDPEEQTDPENPGENTQTEKTSTPKSSGDKALPNTGEVSLVWLSMRVLVLGISLLILGRKRKVER
ncbi:SdrD B-like domain-containing protein, partial [Fundicoccus sp. Sow4_H7]|uniref:SdrD B-like domain-containing protein n=1 Tax=Fundicoccus sp. Sow4_H7 TaxID=3438784 RepID=UPI003F91BC8E